MFPISLFAKDCEIHEEIYGNFNFNTDLHGIVVGNKEIRKIFIENESSLNNSKKFFRKHKRKKILVLIIAPFRTSSDLTLSTNNLLENNKVKITTEYKLSENSLSVLNQKFYLGIYSDDCLIELNNIPFIEEQNKSTKN